LIFDYKYLKLYISILMEWILYLDDVWLYLTGKDSGSNPSETPKIRFTLLKLIYIISSIYKPKNMYFYYFLTIHKVGAEWTVENNILLRSMSLDIQILDPTISS